MGRYLSKGVHSAWCFHTRGAAYPVGPVRFDRPVSEKHMRAWLRDWLGVDRLPWRTEIWPGR
mgnify:CR=1 FL=1